MSCKKTSIGGQALIEGIMMKGPSKTTIAVRLPDGEIELIDHKDPAPQKKVKFLGWPIIRGVTAFVCSMISGYKALMISAEKSLPDEEEEKKADTAENEAPAEENAKKAEKSEKKENGGLGALFTVIMVIASIVGVVLAGVLFMLVPSVVFNLINAAVTPDVSVTLANVWNGVESGSLDLWRGLIEGVMKIAIFVGYVALVSLEKDIKRVFQYHGAEHKTIFCYEAGLPLTVENCRMQKRFHPRCGTSFMFLMIAVSIIISTIIVILFPAVTKVTVLWVAIKILLIPLFCGLGYELIKFCGRHDNIITKIVATPGMWVQRLTTKEPEDDMLEVAIASLIDVIPENGEDDKW